MTWKMQLSPSINVSRLKQALPWWSKILGKICLSQIPVSYQFWGQVLKVFQHGDMSNPEYAWKVFRFHYTRAKPYLPEEFVVCELGPGDSLATAMIAPCYGGKESYLVDVGNFANGQTSFYSNLGDFLRSKELCGFDFNVTFSLDKLLLSNNSHYYTDGVRSLEKIENEKIDFVFSQAVLEHVRLEDFSRLLKELYRVMKPGGIASHEIDLRDHLSDGLNHLRFSNQTWESKLFSSSGFYTNRLRASQIIRSIKQAGFEILSVKENRWEKIPTSRKKFHAEFSPFSEDDLLVNVLEVVHKK